MTPSQRSSIQRMRPVERGWRERGRVRRRERRVGKRRRRERRVCRRGRRVCGLVAEGG
jgi:hypothetical protein